MAGWEGKYSILLDQTLFFIFNMLAAIRTFPFTAGGTGI